MYIYIYICMHVYIYLYLYIHTYIWLCLFLTGAVFSKGWKFDLCESYPWMNHTPNHAPESYPRIIPPKIIIMNVSFGIIWDCIGLTCYNEPDKLIHQCPDPMIPGYLHIPSRSGESSPRAQSLIIIPKLAGSGWLAGWLGGWLSCCCWYRAG